MYAPFIYCRSDLDWPCLSGLTRSYCPSYLLEYPILYAAQPHIVSCWPPPPTDNQPQVTEILKGLLGEDYNYDSTVSHSRWSRSLLFQYFSKFRTAFVHYIGLLPNAVSSKTTETLSSTRTETDMPREFLTMTSFLLVLTVFCDYKSWSLIIRLCRL